MKMKYPNLYEFFGSYFHQDWLEDAPTATDIVRKYIDEWPPQGVNDARAELRQVLSDGLSESSLKGLMQELGCYYSPTADGLAQEAWLKQVLQLLDESVN